MNETRRLMSAVPDPAERLARAEFNARRAVVRARKAERDGRRRSSPVTLAQAAPRRDKVRRIEAAVLLDGVTGTAYQLLHSDGLYHSAASAKAYDHAYMVEHHAVILYRAPAFA